MDKGESTKAIIPDDGTVIPCHTWEISEDPVKLSMLSNLPDLPETGLAEEELRKETKLIKIATSYSGLVGLTNKGHVLELDEVLAGIAEGDPAWNWRYVSKSTRTIWDLFLKLEP